MLIHFIIYGEKLAMEPKRIRPRPGEFVILVLGLVIIIGIYIIYVCFSTPLTTAIIIRHAEIANDSLSIEGQERADKLVHVVGEVGITAIYATQFNRTQQTVQPLATHLGLPVTQYTATDVEVLVDQVLSDHAGEVVFIAGHSNTIHLIVDEFCGDPITPIDEGDFDNMFIVTVYRSDRAEVIHLNYGEPD
jgi:broad specificity phosphatase PhoE